MANLSPLLALFLLLLFPCPSNSSPDSSSILRLPSDDASDPNPCPITPSIDPNTCPVTCFRPDPVCGEDGVTYWCGCADAGCYGKRVVKLGFCEVGNNGGSGSGGSSMVAGQALLLVHIVWMVVLGFSVLCGFL